MRNGNRLNGFSKWSTSDISFRCGKEELRQMILKQESIFRHQLQELHRLYKIQRDLMNEIESKHLSKSLTPTFTFQSSLLSSNDESMQHVHNFVSGFPRSGRIPTLEEARIASESKDSGALVRHLFDLELPAGRYIAQEQEVPPCSESGLRKEKMSASTSAVILGRSRERLQKMDYSASLQASFHERRLPNNLKTVQLSSSGNTFFRQSLRGEILGHPFGSRQVEFKKILNPVAPSSDHQSLQQQTSRKIFGVEISQRNHSGSQLSLQGISAGSNMSSMKSMQGPKIIEDGLLVRGHREAEGPYQMSTDSLLINFYQFVGLNKTEVGMPHRLVQDSSSVIGTSNSERRRVEVNDCSGNGNTLGSYLDKSHSAGGVGSFNSNLMDNSMTPNSAASSITYRVEVKRSVEKNVNACSLREFLDLNVCPTSNEEEAPPTPCSETSHIMPTSGEIDLDAPVLETGESPREESTSSKQGSSVILDDRLGEKNDGLLRVAAETLVAISSACANEIREQIFPGTKSEILQWFAEIIISSLPVSPESDSLNHGQHVSEGMDFFEFATLNLAETKVDELSYKPPVSEELKESLSAERLQNGYTRRGRQDFQRDVLPGLTSLSRSEVTEDLQTIKGLIKSTGRALRAGPLQKKGTSKDIKARGRSNKRKFVDTDTMKDRAIQKPKCRELGFDERALTGWGKRARRPKRPRCSVALHSVTLKEVF